MTKKYSLSALRTFLETVLSQDGKAALVRSPSAYDVTISSLIEIEQIEVLEQLIKVLTKQGGYLERIAKSLELAQRGLSKENP